MINFEEFQLEKITNIDEFTNMAKKLHLGINSGNINYNSYTFDIHGHLSNTGMSLERDARKVRGGLF